MSKRRDPSCQGSLLIDVNGKVSKINKIYKKIMFVNWEGNMRDHSGMIEDRPAPLHSNQRN